MSGAHSIKTFSWYITFGSETKASSFTEPGGFLQLETLETSCYPWYVPSCWLWWYFPSLGVNFHVDSQVGVPGKWLSTVVTRVSPLLPVLLLVVLHFPLLGKPLAADTALVFALASVPALMNVQLNLCLERLWTKRARKSFGIRVSCHVPCRRKVQELSSKINEHMYQM